MKMLRTLAFLAVAALAASAGPVQPRAPILDLARARIVDLTHEFGEKTLYWPTATTGFVLTKLHHGPTPGGYFYSAYSFCAPEHGGTHLDAPVHFAEGRASADQVPLDRVMAAAVVIDVRKQAAADPDYRLSRADVAAWEGLHGAIPAGSIVLLRTGWSARWPNRKAYFGDDTPGDASKLRFPSYGRDAAQLLVERKVAAVGVDTASIDYGATQDFIVHQIVSGANLPGL